MEATTEVYNPPPPNLHMKTIWDRSGKLTHAPSFQSPRRYYRVSNDKRKLNVGAFHHRVIAPFHRALRTPLPWVGSKPPVGRVLVLLLYCGSLSGLLSLGATEPGPDLLERLGFRSAHVSNAQFLVLFLLSSRVSLVGWLLDVSYEKLCWWHR